MTEPNTFIDLLTNDVKSFVATHLHPEFKFVVHDYISHWRETYSRHQYSYSIVIKHKYTIFINFTYIKFEEDMYMLDSHSNVTSTGTLNVKGPIIFICNEQLPMHIVDILNILCKKLPDPCIHIGTLLLCDSKRVNSSTEVINSSQLIEKVFGSDLECQNLAEEAIEGDQASLIDRGGEVNTKYLLGKHTLAHINAVKDMMKQ